MGSFMSSAYATPDTPEGSSRVIYCHSSEKWQLHLQESKQHSKLIVVDFTATWCGPCRMIGPVFNDMADRYEDVEFIRIDVDELPDVAKEFDIKAMPTFVFLKNGKEITRLMGAKKDELESLVVKHK